MKNNLQDIFVMQKQLDEEIFTRYSKTYGDTFAQRKLALIVELAELANEVRSFKY
jgi:dimeric dUTPase (all-alpha-NTP-PPase superfamily)